MARRYFLLCYIFTCYLASVIGQSTTYALEGQEVKLTPNVPGGPDHIRWKHNGNIVVQFNGNEKEVYGSFKNRITLDWQSAELSITQLSFEDSGDYDLGVYMNDDFHHSRHKLEVIDKVAKPTISCHMNNGTSSHISGTLLCSAEPRRPQNLMKFEWSSKGKVHPGPQLVISLGGEYDDEVHICNVSNPLSTETATFTSKDCYPVNSSSAALIASLVIIFITLIAVALGILICYRTRKACFAKKKRDDWKKSSEENGTAEPLLDRAPTLPSTQPLAGRVQHNGNMRPCDSASSQEKNSSDGVQASQQPESPTSTAPDNRSTSRSQESYHSEHDALNQEAKTRKDSAESAVVDGETVESKNEIQCGPKEDKAACDLQDETPRKGFVKQSVKRFEQNTRLRKSKDKHKETTSPPSSPPIESPSHVDQKNLVSTNRSDADADQQSAEEEVPQSAHEPGPAGALEKEDGEDEEAKSPLANGVSPVAQPLSLLIQNSPTVAPDDTTAEHNTAEDTNLDQLSGETDRNLRESDFSGKEKTAESSEDKQPSTVLKQEASETTPPETDSNLSQGEADTNEDNRQKTDKPVCAVENKSESGGDSEGTQQDLCGAASQQPESPTSATPDNRSTNRSQGSSATAHGDSDQEEEAKTRKDSAECAEVEGETAESKNEIQCGPKEDKAGLRKSKDKHKETASPPFSPPTESPSHVDQKNLVSTNRSDADADQQSAEKEVPQSAHEPGPAGESEKEEDENEEAKSPLANGVSPVAQPRSPLIQNSPTVAPDGHTAEHMEDTKLDQLSGETDRNLRESDFSGKEKTAESSEDKQPSTILKQEASETTPPETDSNLSQGEADTNEDNRQKTDKPVCAVENKSERVGDSEGTQQDLCGAASQQPESHTSATPDNRSTNRSQGSSATPRGDSDQEEEAKTRKDSAESAEAEGETAESKNEIQCGPKEDKAACDLQDETPRKGYVRQSIKRFEPNTRLRKSKDKHKETASPPFSPPIESPSHVDQKNLVSTNRSDADADQQSAEEEVPQSAHEPGPAGGLETKLSEPDCE
uniref:neurofilament heavy polypeptide-like isoform X3 n=1 Tax=Scatophagus argus TaxID=75038 RepID=UPI001ED85C9D|nr:neurofilament heavy polypeptide-like isoform X3 [Scatophagus argus]